MTRDVIVLTDRMPDVRAIVDGMLAAGPELRVRAVAGGAVVQLCDDGGRPLVSVEAPILVQVPGEVARLLGPEAAGVDAPAWWVEARESTAVAAAEGLARVLAGRLAAQLGGVLWPPGAAGMPAAAPPAGGTPGPAAAPPAGGTARRAASQELAPAAAQPAVDVLTERVAVVLQDRPVVPMTAWLSDALRACIDSDRGLQIVTPRTSRLSLPTRLALPGPPSRWVVRDEATGYYDGLSGAVLHWRDGMFQPVPAPDGNTPVAAAFTGADGTHGTGTNGTGSTEGTATGTDCAGGTNRTGTDADRAGGINGTGECQLALSLRTRQPPGERLVLGGALEAACRALTGGPPAGWGTAEPASLPWHRAELTDLARRRAPGSTWLVVVGAAGRPTIGTMRVARTASGVEEDVTLAFGYRAGEQPPVDALPELASELVAAHGLDSMLVQRHAGRANLTVPARWQGLPVPVGYALGADAVGEVGLDRASRPPGLDPPRRLGSGQRPGLWYGLGDGGSAAAWRALEQLLRHLRPSPR
jgi:hypothetical protein